MQTLTKKQIKTIRRKVEREVAQEFKDMEDQFLAGIDPSELLPDSAELPKLLDGSDYDWGSFDWPQDDD